MYDLFIRYPKFTDIDLALLSLIVIRTGICGILASTGAHQDDWRKNVNASASAA
jgi:hypothetical protein